MSSVFWVADAILKIFRKKGVSVTPMKLMKLVYIAHGWYLATRNGDLFGERIEAWKYGPVIPDLYHATKKFGREPIPFDKIGDEKFHLPDDDIEFLSDVCEKYGQYSAVELSALTHKAGTPWSQVYRDGVFNIEIPDGLIKRHYEELLNDHQKEA